MRIERIKRERITLLSARIGNQPTEKLNEELSMKETVITCFSRSNNVPCRVSEERHLTINENRSINQLR